MKNFLLTLFFLTSCSHNKPNEKASLQPLVKLSDQSIKECSDYEREVLLPNYDLDKNTFVKDALMARYALKKFDVTKNLSAEKVTLVRGVLNQCTQEKVFEFDAAFKSVNRCNIILSELNFLRALAWSLNSYRWPTDLKLEGKRVALDYVRYYSIGDYPLLNRLIALSVLDELSVNKIVNQDLHEDIKKYMLDAKFYVEGLRKKLTSDPQLTCESMSILKEELEYSNIISRKIQELLLRI